MNRPHRPLLTVLALPVGLLLCAGAASAQVYQWVDERGVTHFGDTPPASVPAGGKVERKVYAAGPAAELSQELASVARSHPVTLYTTPSCAGCDRGRALLQARGIPYAEKTVQTTADRAALLQAGSEGQLPLLLVGRGKLIGYETGSWETLLGDAGYPLDRQLPPNYRNPARVPAAPPAPPDAAEQARAAARAAAEEAARLKRLPPINATADFQF